MNILVVGAGNMGSAFVKRLASAGHRVTVVARRPDAASALASRFAGVRTSAPDAGATEGQDIVVLAVPYSQAKQALSSLGPLRGKVVIDITNPLSEDYMSLTVGHTTSAAEEIAKVVPDAMLVKGFNTLFAQVLDAGATFGDGRTVSVFLASDDATAKDAAAALARSMGFDVVDAGGLRNARYLEPLAGLNVYLGYGAGLGTAISPAWIGTAGRP